jgi:shikimate kinase
LRGLDPAKRDNPVERNSLAGAANPGPGSRSIVTVTRVALVVVLLGVPGSGKSAIGEELARRGLRRRDWEIAIVERWGTREQFIADKTRALPRLHAEILEWIHEAGPIAVIETTGLSDAPLLAELERSGSAVVVRLDVSEDEADRRVAARAQGRHLSDDAAANRAIGRAFRQHVLPRQRADLVIDTEEVSIGAAADSILCALDGSNTG